MSSFFHFAVCFILIFCMQASNCYSFPENAASSNQTIYIARPTSELLVNKICCSNSFISKQSRAALSKLIEDIDQTHVSLFRTSGFNISNEIFNEDNLAQWVDQKTQLCHPLTPPSERAFMAALLLQIEMLDLVLYAKDPNGSDLLRKERSAIRIREKTDKYFGDVRDCFICEVLTRLNQVNDLQRALGVMEKSEWDFPKKAKKFSDIEKYIIEKLVFIKNCSHKIAK